MVVQALKGGSYNEKEHFDNRIYTTQWKSLIYQSSGWVHPTGAFNDTVNVYLCRPAAIPHPEQASNGIRTIRRRNLIIRDAV